MHCCSNPEAATATLVLGGTVRADSGGVRRSGSGGEAASCTGTLRRRGVGCVSGMFLTGKEPTFLSISQLVLRSSGGGGMLFD
mgnify:CR=1 FL=1